MPEKGTGKADADKADAGKADASKGNKGEKAEIASKKLLFERKNDVSFLLPIFGNDSCEGIEIVEIETSIPYTTAEQIKKTKSTSKADIAILFKNTQKIRYCSIKSLSGAKPAILNHTSRNAKAFQTDLQPFLNDIDALAKEYIEKRTQKKIGEDIAFSKLESHKDGSIRSSFINLLTYFIFSGTGSKRSTNECDSILIINKDGSFTFIDCDTHEKKANYVTTIVDKCVISFRNKGMPTKIGEDCLPWIYTNDVNGKQCGSIHIRL